MTVDALIDLVVRRICQEHYVGTSRQQFFHRDRVALEKCVARYGYECDQRGWSFEPDEIWAEIMRILDGIKERTDAIAVWFPVYLEAAIDRHIRIRAEELSAASRKTSNVVGRFEDLARKIAEKNAASPVREPTAVETLSALYKSLEIRRKQRRKQCGSPRSEQIDLL